jgi:chromosome segregation protein
LLVLTEQIELENETSEHLLGEIRDLDAEVGRASALYERTAEASRHDQTAWEQAHAAHEEARFIAAAAKARTEALNLSLADGGDAESRRLASAARGARGALTDLWSVPTEWIPATRAALGAWSSAIAFDSADAVEEVVRELKSQAGGGVPVVGHRSIPAPDVGALAQSLGLEALIDVIGATGGQDVLLARALLGDVLIADGWATGWTVVQNHPQVRVVTPEGDLITTDGILTARSEGHSVVEAEAAQEQAETELARTTSRLKTVQRQFDGSRRAERAALESLEAMEVKLAGATELLGRSRRQKAELVAEQGRLSSREFLLSATIAERQVALSELVASMTILQGEEGRRQALLAELDDRRRQLAKERERTRDLWKEAALAASTATERRSMLDSRREIVSRELLGGDQPGRIVSAETVSRLATVESLARRAIEVVVARISELRGRLGAERDDKRMVELDLNERRRRLLQFADAIEENRSHLAELAVVAAEARVRRESVVESLAREIDAAPEEALGATRPESESQDLPGLLAVRSAELRRMGAVNPLAAEEYRELSARHGFLKGQLEDLEKSRAELRKVMKALDEEIETRFVTAFEEVASNYEEYFTVLFPGGQGRMRLTEPDDPLNSGVEIEAQPHGKKIGKLSLLSGGERSLAALAFLFAVFRARPSPFYILDEVEAALDDANLRRFLRLLEVFRGESQLILITHQQQTMEAADVLYGVTMGGDGVSQIVSRRLPREAAAEAAA